MALHSSQENPLQQIVSMIKEMPDSVQRRLLHQLKMSRAVALARQVDAGKKPRFVISDSEIAEMVHGFRHGSE